MSFVVSASVFAASGGAVDLSRLPGDTDSDSNEKVTIKYDLSPEERALREKRNILEDTVRLEQTELDFTRNQNARKDEINKLNTAQGARTLIGQKRFWADKVQACEGLTEKDLVIRDVKNNIIYLEKVTKRKYPKASLIRLGFKFGYGGTVLGTALSQRKLNLLLDYLKKLHTLLINNREEIWWDLIELNRGADSLNVPRKHIVRRGIEALVGSSKPVS